MEYVWLWLMFAIASAAIASSKGRSGFGWFIIGCLIGPFALMVAAMPTLKKDESEPLHKTHGRCPDCHELVLKEARKCKHCGAELIPTNTPPVTTTPPFDAHQMETYGITYDGMHYIFGEYKYTQLSDAINYAHATTQQAR